MRSVMTAISKIFIESLLDIFTLSHSYTVYLEYHHGPSLTATPHCYCYGGRLTTGNMPPMWNRSTIPGQFWDSGYKERLWSTTQRKPMEGLLEPPPKACYDPIERGGRDIHQQFSSTMVVFVSSQWVLNKCTPAKSHPDILTSAVIKESYTKYRLTGINMIKYHDTDRSPLRSKWSNSGANWWTEKCTIRPSCFH